MREVEEKLGQNEAYTNTCRHFTIILAYCMCAPLIYTMRGSCLHLRDATASRL